jgi:hypothetical protein
MALSARVDLPPQSEYIQTSLPDCAVLVDRHIHKNGGTTVRNILFDNDLRDGWVYWGYGLDHMRNVAASIVSTLTRPACIERRKRAPLRIAAELHYGGTLAGLEASLLAHFGPSSAVRRAAASCACKVVLVTRLRSPHALYTSFWRWAGVDRRQRAESGRFGANMLEWAGVYRNLQSALLLGDANVALEAQYAGVHGPRALANSAFFHCFDDPRGWPSDVRADRLSPRPKRPCNKTGGEGAARVAALRRALGAFDVVGLLERFDETLLLVADAAGLRHLLHPAESPRMGHHTHLPPPSTPFAGLGCASDAACKKAIERVAPVDALIYADAVRLFDQRVATLGEPFARRVATLRRARALRALRDKREAAVWRRAASERRIGRERNVTRLTERAEKLAAGVARGAAAVWSVRLIPKQPVSAKRVTPAAQRPTPVAALGGDGESWGRKAPHEGPPAEQRHYCRGLMLGDGSAADRLCALVHADTQFRLPWRLWGIDTNTNRTDALPGYADDA